MDDTSKQAQDEQTEEGFTARGPKSHFHKDDSDGDISTGQDARFMRGVTNESKARYSAHGVTRSVCRQ
jgi:hypothetical protein